MKLFLILIFAAAGVISLLIAWLKLRNGGDSSATQHTPNYDHNDAEDERVALQEYQDSCGKGKAYWN
jgi:hypothetical protein